MRVSVNLTSGEKERFDRQRMDRFFGSRNLTIRMALALGLREMNRGARAVPKGGKRIGFNMASIDPEQVFEVIAFHIFAKRGAGSKNGDLQTPSREDLGAALAEAFVLGLNRLSDHSWLEE